MRSHDGHGLTRDDIHRTYEVIRPYVRRTPVIELDPRDLRIDAERGNPPKLVLKLELTQRAGSFKVRGAFANLLLRSPSPAGVVAASGGNHGVAVAYAAHRLGVPAKIFVPSISNPIKIEKIRSLGADLVVSGDRYADALGAAQRWATESGAISIHAFDQRETLLGQGTVGLELLDQVEDLDTVLVPVGGGGLIGGIAAYVRSRADVIGVEPTGAPTLKMAREHGEPVDAPTEGIAADALAPRRIGELVFPITQAHVTDTVLVDDDAIRHAQWMLWEAVRVFAEPAAVVGIAALITGAYRPRAGERVAVVISGSNTAPNDLGATHPRLPG